MRGNKRKCEKEAKIGRNTRSGCVERQRQEKKGEKRKQQQQ